MQISTKYPKLRALLNFGYEFKLTRTICTKINTLSNRYRYPIATNLLNHRAIVQNRWSSLSSSYYSTKVDESEAEDSIKYEKACEETLESLSDYFEELIEGTAHLQSADVSYSSGVLTVNFGQPFGTYVINRQSPNRQIWLSSPTSGPKRYDFVSDGEYWIYKHDGVTLHQLLQQEIPKIVKSQVDFGKCSHSRL